MRRLRHHSKGEASADDSCCNQFPGFHVIFSLTPFRLDSLNIYSGMLRRLQCYKDPADGTIPREIQSDVQSRLRCDNHDYLACTLNGGSSMQRPSGFVAQY